MSPHIATFARRICKNVFILKEKILEACLFNCFIARIDHCNKEQTEIKLLVSCKRELFEET